VPDIGKLLSPQSVALIGASSDTEGLRGRIMRIMRSHPYTGRLYPVSRSAAEVQGVKAYPSVDALPEVVDLAILIIPAQFVPDELERCGKAGIGAAVILTSGFAEEAGGAGGDLQAKIRATAKRYDMAVNGPNSEGFANFALSLCPTFSPVIEPDARPLLPHGAEARAQIAIVAQSGGMGFAIFDRGRDKELAFRYVMTTGNEACLETFDYVDFMLDERKTDVFILLIEDVKSPATFKRVAEKALRLGKPIIVGKIGKSESGSRAAASHTAALAGTHDAYRAMFDRYGIIESRDLDEMVDIASAFANCRERLPAGHRVGIFTGSGGGGGWLADACEGAGLAVPEIDAATRATLDVHIPSYGTSQNPIDVTAQGVFKVGYAELARLTAASPSIDGVMVVCSSRRAHLLARDREKLVALAKTSAKPVLFWSYTTVAEESAAVLAETGFPLFSNPHNCARAMHVMADYRSARERSAEYGTPAPKVDVKAARETLAKSGQVLTEWDARPLLQAYGIAVGDKAALVHSAQEAEHAARAIDGPVALKVQSGDILHKTEAGAVAINVAPGAAAEAYERILSAAKRHAPGAAIQGVLVQPMAPAGREIILGIKHDVPWGPMLMVGLGGVLVEVMQDVALAPVPMTPSEARALIAKLKGAPLLGAYRGAPAADIEALADTMVRLSHLAHDHAGTIAEIDLNPVLVHPQGQGVSVVDALIVKHPSAAAAGQTEGKTSWSPSRTSRPKSTATSA
jgi:acyl-CoA synthetase (NDP forming)